LGVDCGCVVWRSWDEEVFSSSVSKPMGFFDSEENSEGIQERSLSGS